MNWLSYLQALGIVLLVLSLLPIGLYFYKKLRHQRFPSSNRIKVIEIRPITYKAQLLLIEVEGKRLLIGYSDAGFSYLGEVKPEDKNLEETREDASFSTTNS